MARFVCSGSVRSYLRAGLFDDMKALTMYFRFDNWGHLLNFMLEGWSHRPESRIIRPAKPEIG